MWADLYDHVLWLQVGFAVLCGGVVGLERQLRGKPAGVRTSILICLGTAVFMRIGATLHSPAGDPSRVLGQIITGIGFLGAGVILTRGGLVTGVTTAAVVWMLAGIGATIGAGRYAMACALTAVTVGTLVVMELLERVYLTLRRGVHGLHHREAGQDETRLEE